MFFQSKSRRTKSPELSAALCQAVADRNLEQTIILLKAGANPHSIYPSPKNDAETIGVNQAKDGANLLLSPSLGQEPNEETVMCRAARNGDIEIFTKLLQFSEDLSLLMTPKIPPPQGMMRRTVWWIASFMFYRYIIKPVCYVLVYSTTQALVTSANSIVPEILSMLFPHGRTTPLSTVFYNAPGWVLHSRCRSTTFWMLTIDYFLLCISLLISTLGFILSALPGSAEALDPAALIKEMKWYSLLPAYALKFDDYFSWFLVLSLWVVTQEMRRVCCSTLFGSSSWLARRVWDEENTSLTGIATPGMIVLYSILDFKGNGEEMLSLFLDRVLPFQELNTPLCPAQQILRHAAGHGYLTILRRLIIKGIDTNISGPIDDANPIDTTPIELAATANNPKAVSLLLNHGAHYSPHILSFACLKTESESASSTEDIEACIQTITLLLDAGADVNFIPPDGRTALMSSTAPWQLLLLKKLLEYGADVNVLDSSGMVALHYACMHSGDGRDDVCQVLLDKGSIQPVDEIGMMLGI